MTTFSAIVKLFPDVVVAGREILDLAVRENADGTAIVLHNLNNPMMMKGPIRAVYPAGKQTVSVAIPKGRSFRQARLLVNGAPARSHVSDGRVDIEVPGIDTLEAVHITWG